MNPTHGPPAKKLLYHENSGDVLWEGMHPLLVPQNTNVTSVQQKYLQEQSLHNLEEPSGYGWFYFSAV